MSTRPGMTSIRFSSGPDSLEAGMHLRRQATSSLVFQERMLLADLGGVARQMKGGQKDLQEPHRLPEGLPCHLVTVVTHHRLLQNEGCLFLRSSGVAVSLARMTPLDGQLLEACTADGRMDVRDHHLHPRTTSHLLVSIVELLSKQQRINAQDSGQS